MYYQLQIFLMSSLLILGMYELFQLTKWGRVGINSIRFSIKWLYHLVMTKKAWKSDYKYQHNEGY